MNDYHLKIADDNGEIELELSPLESSNPVGRFGFNCLALIEKSESPNGSTKSSSKKSPSKFNVLM